MIIAMIAKQTKKRISANLTNELDYKLKTGKSDILSTN